MPDIKTSNTNVTSLAICLALQLLKTKDHKTSLQIFKPFDSIAISKIRGSVKYESFKGEDERISKMC